FGTGPFVDPEVPEQLLLGPWEFPAGDWLIERARQVNVEDSKPIPLIMGRDLITLGYKPGVDFGRIIQIADDLRDDKEMTKEQVLRVLFEQKNKDTQKAITNLTKLLIK
ncbi:hypothetical protein ACFLZY_01445, partial [Patescibacteria group bacterium]